MNDFEYVLSYLDVEPRRSRNIVSNPFKNVSKDHKLGYSSLEDWILKGLGHPCGFLKRISA